MPFTQTPGLPNFWNGTSGDDSGTFGATNDVISALAGNDTVSGGAGNDIISGGDGNDLLYGEAGNDALDGGAGNDTMSGGTGTDTLMGGTGNDTYQISDNLDTITEAAGEGIDTANVYSNQSAYTLAANVENMVFETLTGVFTATGNALGNIMQANGQASANGAVLFGLGGDDTLYATIGTDQLYGGEGNDKLFNSSTGDFLDGGAGDDVVIVGGTGVAALGGEGFDTLDASNWGSAVSFNLGTGANNLAMTFTGFETIIGGSGADTLTGGAGNERFQGGAGADSIDGGEGDDVFVFASGAELDGDASMSAGLGYDRFDVALGNTNWSTSLFNAVGLEELRLTGAGVQSVSFTTAYAVNALETGQLIISAGEACTSLRIDASVLGTDFFVPSGRIYAIGTAGGDILTGGAAGDTFQGGGGNDIMRGSYGNDQYVINDVGDGVIELAGQGTDTAWVATNGWTMAANVEIGRLIGTATNLQGGSGDEDLVANAAAATGSTINGGGGHDVLWGSAMADTLRGDAGDDILRGYGGADQMWGGTGTDHFIIDNAGVVVTELANEGYDTAWVTVNGWTNALNVEVVYLSGNATQVTGSAMAENLVANGNLGGNLNGQGGNDILWGSNQADTMRGGTQDDIHYGYGGADTFVFDSADWGWDQISDFSAAQGDKLDFRGSGASFASLGVNTGNDTIVTFGPNSITLYGVTSFSAADCIFA